jgi:hypothetical protein
MVFTNRWVCKSIEDFDIVKIRDRLKKYYRESKGEKHKLVSMITLEPEVVANDKARVLIGRLIFQREIEEDDFEITEEREIRQKKRIRRITESIDFWFSTNPGTFLFRNKGEPVIQGREVLSTIIFGESGKIKSLEYNIDAIENAINSGIFQGMWTFSYKDRQGNIHSGNAFGTNVNQDPMYNQTLGAPRNFIGIEYSINNEIVKIEFYRSGTIKIFSDLEDPTNLPELFRLIEGFEAYAQIVN